METGLSGLTIDDIFRCSAVAKTTIYRHWPNRSALVIDACSRMTDGEVAPPDSGSLEGDLKAIFKKHRRATGHSAVGRRSCPRSSTLPNMIPSSPTVCGASSESSSRFKAIREMIHDGQDAGHSVVIGLRCPLADDVMNRSGQAPAWPTAHGRYGRHPGPPRPSRSPRTGRAPRPGRAVGRHHPGCARVRRRLRTRSRCNRRGPPRGG